MSTINLPSGLNLVASFEAGNTYIGTESKTIFDKSVPVPVKGDGIVVKNCTFLTGGIRRDGALSSLVLENNIFRGCHVAVENNQANGLTIRSCLFDHCGITTWISDMSNLLIEQNEVVECDYGFKAFGDSTANKNRIYQRNWIHDCTEDFMAFELQGACDGWQVLENLVERIRFGPLRADNDHSLLISAPMDKSRNGVVRSNLILGQRPKGPTGDDPWINGHPLLLEIGGDNTLVENNLLDGGGKGVQLTDKVGSCSVTLRNNLIRNVYAAYGKDTAIQVLKLEGVNDSTAKLDFTENTLRKLVGRSATSPPIQPSEVEQLRTQLQVVIAADAVKAAMIAAGLKALGGN